MTQNIESIFSKERCNLAFRRINSVHPSDIYLGYNDKYEKSLVIVEYGNEKCIESSQIIQAQLYIRSDKKTRLEFVLKNNKFETMFYKFCEDIIISTQNVNKNKVISFVVKRWNASKTAFQRITSEKLSDKAIMGLLGELIFMKNEMIPQYGINKSIIAWEGPDSGHKDYVIDDTWYEIKTISFSSDIAKISSIEQLDSEIDGYLKIIRLEKTNQANVNAINLNMLVENIKNDIQDEYILKRYLNKLSEINYYFDEYYNDKCFEFKGIEEYRIDKYFPCIRRSSVPLTVNSVQYELRISMLRKENSV